MGIINSIKGIFGNNNTGESASNQTWEGNECDAQKVNDEMRDESREMRDEGREMNDEMRDEGREMRDERRTMGRTMGRTMRDER